MAAEAGGGVAGDEWRSGCPALTCNRLQKANSAMAGGWGGIRTHGGREPTPVFKTGALNHSATHPSSAARLGAGRPYSIAQGRVEVCRGILLHGRGIISSATTGRLKEAPEINPFGVVSALTDAELVRRPHAPGLRTGSTAS